MSDRKKKKIQVHFLISSNQKHNKPAQCKQDLDQTLIHLTLFVVTNTNVF